MIPSLETIEHEPPSPAIGSVIWLHGLGADGHDFTNIVSQLNLPATLHLRFIFPHAPIRPVSLNANAKMRAWFNLYSLDNLDKIDLNGIKQSQLQLDELIKREMLRGIKTENICLAGFSQGGAMALYTGLRYPKKLAGLIGLSTFLPLIEKLPDEKTTTNDKTPIFLGHGTSDPILPLELGQIIKTALARQCYPVEWREYPMQHQVCLEEIRDIARWLTTCFQNTLAQ